ncbi:MAG: hypothetical protein JWO86_3416 [Myxococcaceae bacterium]|nr:hypothetical protein [Myxococcaceae bacterium]
MHIKTSRKTGGRTLESRTLTEEFVAKELTRRQMVQSVMLATVGTWLGASGLAGCGSNTTTTAGTGAPAPAATGTGEPDPGMMTPATTQHLVGMGYDATDRTKALQAALAETLGLGMIKPGDSVYLRVNSNSGDMYPYSTSPETLLAVGGMLKDLGVTDLRIGDRSFWGDTGTAANLVSNGITGAAKKLGTSAVVFDDSVDWMTLPAASVKNWKGTVRLPAPVTSADHHIILSCVKTHFIATVTMSLKIALGLVHADDRARDGNLKNHDTTILFNQVAQINKAFTPSLIIADGYSAVISGGPTKNDKPPGAPSTFKGGITGDPKVFIVSTDRIAADVAGISVLQTLSPSYELVTKTKPFANPAIKAAIAAGGLGISDASAYDLSGPTVPMLATYLAKVTG